MNFRSLRKLMLTLKRAQPLRHCSRPVRRAVVGVVGATVLFIGIALIVLPGPAFIVIPLGLMILATEFIWARRCLQKVRQWFRSAKLRIARGKSMRAPSPVSARE
jgi:uncharacterized protein (TIGR02611 family)